MLEPAISIFAFAFSSYALDRQRQQAIHKPMRCHLLTQVTHSNIHFQKMQKHCFGTSSDIIEPMKNETTYEKASNIQGRSYLEFSI